MDLKLNDKFLKKNDNLNEISSTSRSLLNFKDSNKWIYQLEWMDKEQLIEIFNEFNEILLMDNNLIIKNQNKLFKNKNEIIKKLIKLPLKQTRSNENKNRSNNKLIRILSLDHKFRIEIISQLINNENIIINLKDKIDDDNKSLLYSKNQYILAKLVKLPVELVNVDLLNNKKQLDDEMESEDDIELGDKFKYTKFNNSVDHNLKNELIELRKQLDNERIELNKLKSQLKETDENAKEKINNLEYDKNNLRRQIETLKQQLDYERLKNKKLNDTYDLELDKLKEKLNNSKFLVYGGFLRDVENFFKQDNEFRTELFTYLNLGLQLIVKSRLDEEDGIRYLALYLNIDDNSQSDVKWKLKTSYELRLKSLVANKPDKIKSIEEHTFTKSSRHGRRRFAKVEEIFDPNNCFISNDGCINLEIYLKVIKMDREIV